MDPNLLAKYTNKWVALTSNRKKVIASSGNVKDLDKKIKPAKKAKVIYHFVLPINGSYAPTCLN